ncbi:hypothetical protein BJ912DRAFT_1092151 [Pholiota molesta]|nr:hypothetical protein BJ912DRAFT_1092151 [Pholiota molesta]
MPTTPTTSTDPRHVTRPPHRPRMHRVHPTTRHIVPRRRPPRRWTKECRNGRGAPGVGDPPLPCTATRSRSHRRLLASHSTCPRRRCAVEDITQTLARMVVAYGAVEVLTLAPLFDASPANEPALSWLHPMHVDHPPCCLHTTTMPPQPTMSSGGTRTPLPTRHAPATSFRDARTRRRRLPTGRTRTTSSRAGRDAGGLRRCPHTTTTATHRAHPRHVVPRRTRCGWTVNATV